MLASTIYVPRATINPVIFETDKLPLLQIFLMKSVVILSLMILTQMVQQDSLAQFMAVLVALDFWCTKNFGRKLLHVHWYVDSQSGQDKWVFEASLAMPSQTMESMFWYSFLLYGIMLLVYLFLSLSLGYISLSCSIFLGICSNMVNFWAFSKVIKLRNNGTLNKLVQQVVGADGDLEMTIQLPLLTNNFKNAS